MSTPSNAPRPSVMQLAIKEKGALYAAYIPFFVEGGIFVPTQRDYKLGDDVYVLLTLPEDTQRYPVAGRVAWVTPARAAGSVGVAGCAGIHVPAVCAPGRPRVRTTHWRRPVLARSVR